MFVIFLGGHFAWFGVERAFLLFLWIYCIYRGDPVATATKADEYPPFIKWVFGLPEVHVFIFSAFVEWSILLIITINLLDKVLNHTCIYIDGGTFSFIESKCKTNLFYPIYKVNTVLNILVHGFKAGITRCIPYSMHFFAISFAVKLWHKYKLKFGTSKN